MSSLSDVFFMILPFVPISWMLFISYRRRDTSITPLEHRKFKQLRKDIKTIKKSQPKSRYQSSGVLDDIFSYMPTRSWDFEGHSEFGKDRRQYYWSAPCLRAGKWMTVTIAWNTKYEMIDYISTHVRDSVGVSSYAPGYHPSEIDENRKEK